MTIVKKAAAILYHPLKAIDQEVGDLILTTGKAHATSENLRNFTIRPALQVLEAYCDITGQRITMETLRSPLIEHILEGYTAALAGEELVSVDNRQAVNLVRRIYNVLEVARAANPDLHPVTWDFNRFATDPAQCQKMREASDFHKWYWKGWTIERKRGGGTYLRLAPLVANYGREFTENIFNQLEQYYRGRGNDFRIEWNFMFDYLHENRTTWPLKTFSDEGTTKDFMEAFTIHTFSEAEKANQDYSYKSKSFGKFLTSAENSLCKSGAWPKLTAPFERPPAHTKHPSQTRTRDQDGLTVQEKTLTSIPLHVTDAEAVEYLFFHIKKDLTTVRDWATAQANDLRARYKRRATLAKEGTPIIKFVGRGLHKQHSLADICATLESLNSEVPFKFLRKIHKHHTGEDLSAAGLANAYGFPLKGCLYPLQCLLVMEHPEITADFLNGFELYNENGVLTGFDETKRTLTGYKNRKKPDVREQVIELNDTTFEIVNDIISITHIGRKKLKAEGNQDYRYLFINSGKGASVFGLDIMPLWNDSSFKNNKALKVEILKQFRPHSDLPEEELLNFIQRARIGRIRCSAVVSIFIKTKSSEATSRALGHEEYNPDLLSHYLPEALLSFIKARWIRIFQKAMVCEAMKDSPHLLRVTKFANMDELDAFLENHRIKEIPSEAADPERKAKSEQIENSEAVLSVGVPFLASILSLEAAVTASTDRARVCGKAEYWASFASKIKTEIASSIDRKLKKYLATALQLVDAKKMEELIYVPAHWA